MQTYKSQWGRRSITVSDECPTFAIIRRLGSVHVGTPDADVRKLIRAGVRAAKQTDQRWTDEFEAEAVRFAIWEHRENQAEYRGVMSGRFEPRTSIERASHTFPEERKAVKS